jgi:hypothetical protein
MNIALIKDKIVTNVVVCESIELATALFDEVCICVTEGDVPHIGISYDAETGFEQPALAVPEENT